MEFRTPTTGMKQEPELDQYLIPRPLYHYQQEGAESLDAGLVTSLNKSVHCPSLPLNEAKLTHKQPIRAQEHMIGNRAPVTRY